jgi:2-polyprenyl-6-methoxyphenol hydroxylase-like FAD-dependent oxidoreductase
VLAALGGDQAELLHHDIEELELESWRRGPIGLLGDAAHAMTPNLGQGAAMAIEDAIVLARELNAHESAVAGLVAYEARRRPRVQDIQIRSRRLGKVAQWQAPLAVRARNWLLRGAPDGATQKTVERVVSYVP